jgi:hypothetical protein
VEKRLMRELLILLLGVIIGIGIGYYGESLVKSYITYNFPSTLTLTSDLNTTTVSIGQTVIFKATLTTIIPSELSPLKSQLEQIVLNNKPIILEMKDNSTTYWSIISTEYTIYGVEATCSFTFTFQTVGTFDFKVVFQGDNILQSSESQVITLTVT